MVDLSDGSTENNVVREIQSSNILTKTVGEPQ
jgi:hypothetical protein